MDRQKLQHFKQKLLDEKDRISDTIDAILANGMEKSQREEVDELSMIDNHPADLGSEMFDKERRFALLDNEKDIINRIDNALNRIDEGTYGQCELCGKEIDEERLEFMPDATTCIECEDKKRNYKTYRNDRPVEEEVITPFGKNFRDISGDMNNDLAYDGEDSWQDVAKYEKRPGIIRNFDDFDSEITPKSETEGDGGIVDFMDNISNEQYKNQLP